jgi:hypothetical protein
LETPARTTLTLKPCAGDHVHTAAALLRREVVQAQAHAQAHDDISVIRGSMTIDSSSTSGDEKEARRAAKNDAAAAAAAATDAKASFACVQGSMYPSRPNVVRSHPSGAN